MVTGEPSLERRVNRAVKAYVIGNLIYALLILVGLGFMFWLASISDL